MFYPSYNKDIKLLTENHAKIMATATASQK